MGMEYARLYFEFLDGEKAQFLFDECGDHGLVCLMRLWVRAGQRNNDGVFEKSGRALEKIAKWKGKPGKLVDTLLDSDFPLLDKLGENEFYLHNYIKNNPHLCEKAKQIRTEKARRAGLASAEKKKQEATTSQLQVNSESTASQLNSTQGQLGSTNVTKRNVTKGKVNKEKSIKKKVNAKRDYIPYEKIVEHYNKTFGAHRLPDTAATIGHINNAWEYALKRPDYKDNPEEAFYKVHENVAEKCKKDPSQLEWSKPENIYRMGSRSSNFENHLNQLKEKEVDLGIWGANHGK